MMTAMQWAVGLLWIVLGQGAEHPGKAPQTGGDVSGCDVVQSFHYRHTTMLDVPMKDTERSRGSDVV